MATDVFVDCSATYNGDGTSATQATVDGGVGAYNNLADAAANAPSGGAIVWVRRTTIATTSISFTSLGQWNNPNKLIGWPIHVEKTGQTVDSVPTGTDSIGFDNATWQFIDASLTEDDNYWVAATVTFTSGANAGLSRKVIWFDATNDQVYLDFPLPNLIAVGDTYDIVLETEEYANRPQSGIDAGWDADSNVRPVIDGGGGAFNLLVFASNRHWNILNLELRNVDGTHHLIYYVPGIIKNCLLHDCGMCLQNASYDTKVVLKDVYFWNARHNLGCFGGSVPYMEITDCHIQGESGFSRTGKIVGVSARLKNCTFGRVIENGYDIKVEYTQTQYGLEGENVILASPTKVSLYRSYIGGGPRPYVSISGYNGEPDKYHQWWYSGEVYNVDSDATINPPSGASTYIKLLPSSTILPDAPLKHIEQRYQAAGSKTYTWKFYPAGWTALTTTDIEVTAWYLDESTGTHRAEIIANPTTVTSDAWNDLSITVNPAQAGTVYFEIKLTKYESGAFIALDPKVDVA